MRTDPRRVVSCAISIVATAACVVFAAEKSDVPGDRASVEAVLQGLVAAIEQGDQSAALGYFGGDDQTFLHRVEGDITNLLQHEELEYSSRLTDVVVSYNTALAVAFEKLHFLRDGRSQTEVAWQTIGLSRGENGWRIVALDDRDYLQPEFTDLAVDLRPEERHLTATARLDLAVTEGGEDNIILSLNRGLTVDTISLADGEVLEFERSDTAVIIPWATPLVGNERISLTVAFSGRFFNEFEEQGYSLVNVGPEGCFANFVTDWYPRVNGRLTKTLGRIAVTVPKDLTVASVGRLDSTTTEGDRSTFVYKVSTAMDFTFNANRFFHRSKVIDGVPVNVYFLSGGQEKADLYSSKAMEVISYSTEIYGIFPFDSYNISEVPPEITGGLGGSGGQGLNFYPRDTLNETSFNLPLIAHESGHMWWGSWVLSEHRNMIDEGFCQLNAVLNIRHFSGEQAMRDFVKNGTESYPQSAKLYFKFFGQGDNDLPLGVHDENETMALNLLAYTKAYVVYVMLMDKVGDETFLRGLRRIVDEYANRYFDLDAFRTIMEDESGQDLGQFWEQWFHRTGAPEFELEYAIEEIDQGYSISGAISQVREIYQVEGELALITDSERTIKKIAVTGEVTPFTFVVSQRPAEFVFDPDYKILRWTDEFKALSTLGYARSLTHQGEPAQAVAVLSDFVDEYPNNREGRFLLAVALIALERPQEATAQLEAVVQDSDPTGFTMADWPVPLSHVELGSIYEARGEPDTARMHYMRALEYPNVDDSHKAARSALDPE